MVEVASRTCPTSSDNVPGVTEPARRLGCPYCSSYEVERLYLASVRLDSCRCRACGAGWDETLDTGEFRGRAQKSSAAAASLQRRPIR
jgi:hypothetical protein